MIKEILNDNQNFVREKKYIDYATDKYPSKNIVILTCMDTRLTKLLPNALNLKNGDAKIIKNAGAMITHPFGSVMRSIVVAIHELECQDVLVVGHYACGMHNLKADDIIANMIESGIDPKVINDVDNEIDLQSWLSGFDNQTLQIKDSVETIKKHPLIPQNINVYGALIDPTTGELTMID